MDESIFHTNPVIICKLDKLRPIIVGDVMRAIAEMVSDGIH